MQFCCKKILLLHSSSSVIDMISIRQYCQWYLYFSPWSETSFPCLKPEVNICVFLLLLVLHRQYILYSCMPPLSTEGCRKVGNCLRTVQTQPASSSQPCPLTSDLENDGIHHLHCIHHATPCSWTSLNSSVNCVTLLFMHFFAEMSFVSSDLDILLSAALL